MTLPNFTNKFGVSLKSLLVNPTQFANSMTISVGLDGTASEPLEIYASLGSIDTPRQALSTAAPHILVFSESDVVPALTAYGSMNLSINLVNGAETLDTIVIPVNRESVTSTKYVRTFKEYDGGFGVLRATKTQDKVEPLGTTTVVEATRITDEIFEVPVVSDLLTMELVE